MSILYTVRFGVNNTAQPSFSLGVAANNVKKKKKYYDTYSQARPGRRDIIVNIPQCVPLALMCAERLGKQSCPLQASIISFEWNVCRVTATNGCCAVPILQFMYERHCACRAWHAIDRASTILSLWRHSRQHRNYQTVLLALR